MLERHILLVFISIAFLSKACYYYYRLRKKDKGILVKHYFHITSICRVGVELFKFRPWFGSLFCFKEKKKDKVAPTFPVVVFFFFVFN